MSKQPGQLVYDGRTVSFPTDGNVEPGDAVSLTGGDLSLTDADNMVGIVSDQAPEAADQDAGDTIPVHTTGVVVANVQDGVTAGASVTEPDTATAGHVAGQLESGGDGQMDAFSDEGGQFKQHDSSTASLDAGYAAVHLG